MLVPWIGGKSKLASQIIGTFPPHTRYIEPFFGGGWVFFKKSSVKESFINDINGDLINLYRIVRDRPHELIRQITLTPKSEDEFNQFQLLYIDKDAWLRTDEVRRALVYFFLIKNAFNANPANTFGVKATGNWGSDGLLETLHFVSAKLQNATILNRDFMSVLSDYASSESLVYLDPPYAVTIKGGETYYEYVLPKERHVELRDALLTGIKAFNWVLSYDIHEFVTELYKDIPGVFMHKTSEVFQSSINKHGKYVDENTYDTAFKSEYLITNFDIQQQVPLFGGI